ncbi:hypothetical protein GCM10010486_35680 [Nonomuraea roseoviolacea subsp. carminata]
MAVLDAALMVTILCVVIAPVYGSVMLAARTAPISRHARLSRPHLVWGVVLTAAGVALLVVTARSSRVVVPHDPALAFILLAALAGAALLLLGIGPFVPWLAALLGRRAVRLAAPVRLAAQGAAGPRAAAVAATTASATALALTFMIVGTAQTAQERAAYSPQARSGALVVTWPSAEQAAAVRAAVQQELPGVPIVQSYRRPVLGYLSLNVHKVDGERESDVSAVVIGDEGLLRYLTGDPSTPYDEQTAVIVTADGTDVDKVTVDYEACGNGDTSSTTKILSATAARPAAPQEEKIFLPAPAVRELGCRPEPEELLIDPSVHRTTAIEQERLDRRLGASGTTFVEQGFQAQDGWKVFAGAAIALALGAALTMTRRTPADSRPMRVLLRVGGGPSLRWFAACHAGLVAACGTVTGAAAGCVMGLQLAWPLTAPGEWESPPRVPFEPPWPAIAVLVAGLPVLVAAIAAVLGTTRRGNRGGG